MKKSLALANFYVKITFYRHFINIIARSAIYVCNTVFFKVFYEQNIQKSK